GASRNARLFRAAERLPVRRLTGSAAVRVAAPVRVADEDLVVRRLRGLSPIQGTDVDPLLRDLGCRTLIVTGVSADVAVPDAVFDAVNPRLHGRPAHRRRRGRARRLHPRDDPAHPVPGRHPGDHGRGAHGVRPGPARHRAPAAQARVIESPSTVIGTDGSGLGAGPPCTLPSVMEKLLSWQGQLMTPSETLCTAHPRWVQVAENALNSPADGWVTTTLRSAKTLPPPSGISAVVVSAPPAPPPLPPSPAPPSAAPRAEEPESAAGEVSSEPPHAVSAAARPAAVTVATTARRPGPVGASSCSGA